MANKKNAHRQSKHFIILLYTEWPQVDILIHQIQLIAKHYAYIIHDKDIEVQQDVFTSDLNNDITLKKPHIHLVLEMQARRSINGLYEALAKYCPNFTQNLIQIPTDLNSQIRYLTHIDYQEKYQYSIDEVITDDKEWFNINYQLQCDDKQAFTLLNNYINTQEVCITTSDISTYAINKNIFKFYRKNFILIKQLVYEHNKEIQDYEYQKDKTLNARTKIFKEFNARHQTQNVLANLGSTFDRVVVEDEKGNKTELINTGRKIK